MNNDVLELNQGFKEINSQIHQNTNLKNFQESLFNITELIYVNRFGRPVGTNQDTVELFLQQLNKYLSTIKKNILPTKESEELILELKDNYKFQPIITNTLDIISESLEQNQDNTNYLKNRLRKKLKRTASQNLNLKNPFITYSKNLELSEIDILKTNQTLDQLILKHQNIIINTEKFSKTQNNKRKIQDAIEFYLLGEIPKILINLPEEEQKYFQEQT